MLIYLSEEHGDKSTQIKSWDQEKTSVFVVVKNVSYARKGRSTEI